MFTTFYGTPPRAAGHRDSAPTNRPKRSQVRRACDWCKLMRIKCDSRHPCYNCQQAGRECAINSENQFRSMAAAVKYPPRPLAAASNADRHREVERLRAQVRQLESQTSRTSPRLELPEPYAYRPSASRNGVRVDSILYGVASLPFFLTRMSHFLPQLDISACTGGARTPPAPGHSSARADYLTRAQEDHFLDLFWQTHYFSFPILNEGHFRGEYQALWADSAPGGPRKASPLVDIVLALCVQLGAFFVHHAGEETGCVPSLAGFQYYRRCQDAIDATIESPSITTVQCYIFSIVYLYEAGLLNRAQVVAGKATVMAMILGLPSEPLGSEPETQKELARRTWWSLYILDATLCFDVGRPPTIGPSHSTCRLPSDSAELAQSLGPHYMFDDTCLTWLGFQTQTLRLLNAVRTVQSALYAKYDDVVGEGGYPAFSSNGQAREETARLVTEQMRELAAWARQVPDNYLVPRRNGQPYSTDRSPLDLSTDIPVHCQRQRLLLELQYHHHCMSLYQPFICLASSAADVPTPLSDSKAAQALQHAMTLTSMIHQALTSSETLNGVYHVFQWQKNALFTLLGFAYTFPVSPSTAAAAPKAIDTAVAVVGMYRDVLPEAGPVAQIARTLADDVADTVARFRSCGTTSSSSGGGWSSASSTLSLASSADTVATSSSSSSAAATAVPPPADHHPDKQHDLSLTTTTTTTADELLDLGFLQDLAKVGTNWEAMDMLWASLDPDGGTGGGGGPRIAAADAWAAVGGGGGGGDDVGSGPSEPEMDSS